MKNKQKQKNRICDRWSMLRWITTFIKENQENWEKETMVKKHQEQEKLEAWSKMKRFEKIKTLKQKWLKENTEQEKEQTKISEIEEWNV